MGGAPKELVWTKFGKSWEKFLRKFRKEELSPSGIVVRVVCDDEEVRSFLIGDINTTGGVCDDCMAFDPDAIVKEYRWVDIYR